MMAVSVVVMAMGFGFPASCRNRVRAASHRARDLLSFLVVMEELLRYPPGADGFAGLTRGTRMRQPHTHRELEVNLVLTGRAAYLVGARRVPLLAGSMIWLFPRQEHLLIDSSSDFSMWVLVFRPALVAHCAGRDTRRILGSPDPGEILCRQLVPPRVEALNRLYQGAVDEKGDLEFVNATLRYALVESWRAYLFSGELIPSTQVHPAVARAARIVTDATTPLSLEDVAQQAGLSPARLSRLFQQQVGVTLTAFRQQKCLERFLRLYGAGARHSLIEAALLAGFGSYPQFHRVFCRLMKKSPLAYKRQFRPDLAPPAKPAPPKKALPTKRAKRFTRL
jgi:AraC-like DNA-binding protein